MNSVLNIRELHASVDGKPILRVVNLDVRQGEIHALMGPHGNGTSTLAKVLLGHPGYEVTGGDVLLDGESILDLAPDERSRKGLFLAFQYPASVPGLTVANFIRSALNAHRKAANPDYKGISIPEFRTLLKEKMDLLEMSHDFAGRYLNDGFSGGEKKRNEILQMAALEPRFAVLDETDSGLDIDALRIVSSGVNALRGPQLGVLIITHYQRILKYIQPDFVHILMDGRVVQSGDASLAEQLEERGYYWVREQQGMEVG